MKLKGDSSVYRISAYSTPPFLTISARNFPPVLPQNDSETFVAQYELEVFVRIKELRKALSADELTPDVTEFLRRLGEARASAIRPAPVAAQKALAKTQNPDIGINQLVEVVETDPTLCQALLKYANSAYYATGGPTIVSLKQAAQRIGVSGVHNVVLGTLLEGVLCKPGNAYMTMVEQVRTHMVRTAPLARALARGFAVPGDDAFALALLHDVGKLIIFDTIGEMRHEMRREIVISPTVMHKVLQRVHEPLGGLALVRWSLGVPAARSIASHHRAPAAEGEDRMGELLFIAERAEHAMNGLRVLDFDHWWYEGSIAGSWKQVAELFTAYSASVMATA